MVTRADHKLHDYPGFVESLHSFVANNRFDEIIVPADGFIQDAVEAAKLSVRVDKQDDSQ
jgi:hypothetical protein